MENAIINSLKRLERAGEENSKTNQKLKDATYKVADIIAKQLDAVLGLERTRGDYLNGEELAHEDILEEYDLFIRRFWSDSDGWYEKAMLQKGDCCLNITKAEMQQLDDSYDDHYLRETHRKDALIFANDIANGLLDKIANLIEEKIAEMKSTLDILEKQISKEK